MENNDWYTPAGCTNSCLDGEDFYISYNEMPWAGVGFMASDTGGGETAIVIVIDDHAKFFILNGDFRNDYAPLVPKGIEACLDFYDNHRAEHGSSWSSDFGDMGEWLARRIVRSGGVDGTK